MKIKDTQIEKGAIGIFVLVGMLFMTAFLILIFSSNMTKEKVLEGQYNMMKDIYAGSGNDASAYEEVYTDLRRKNTYLKTTSVENKNSMELFKTIQGTFQNYKIYGRGSKQYIQNRLPEQYQEVEYIETTGTQYINTGYVIKTKPKIETEIMLRTTEDRDIMGTPSAENGCFIIDYSDAQKSIWYRYSTSSAKILSYTTAIANVWTKTVWGQDIYHEDKKIGSANTGWDFSTNTKSFYIGKGRSNTSARFKEVKLYDNDVLVRDMIPCYRRLDGVIGMYDIVSNVFYTNAGTGTFRKGDDTGYLGNYIKDETSAYFGKYEIPIRITNQKNEITNYSIYLDEPLEKGDYLDFAKQQIIRGSGTIENVDLPSMDAMEDYTKLEIATLSVASKIEVEYWGYYMNDLEKKGYRKISYLETTGTQFINTKYVFQTKPKVEAEIMLMSTEDLDIMGNTKAVAGCFIIDHRNTTLYYRYGQASRKDMSCKDTMYQKWTKCVWGEDVYYNNKKLGTANTGWDFSTNTQIFYIGKGRTNGKFRFKEVKLYDNDILVRDLVPCYRIVDRKVGMYDLVNDIFYTNAGTGEFVTEAF